MTICKLHAIKVFAAGAFALFASLSIGATLLDGSGVSPYAGPSSVDAVAPGKIGPLDANGVSADQGLSSVEAVRQAGDAVPAPAKYVTGAPGVIPSPLLAIDQNRTTVVKRIVAQWGDALLTSGAGINKQQLEEMLGALRADQLLAASLVANLDGLRAVVADAVAARSDTGGSLFARKAVGNAGADLVYTPIAPCRIVDTVSVGGPIPALGTRSFKGTTATNFSAQGGSATACGIPLTAAGLQTTMTVVSPPQNGYMLVYPFNTPQPTAFTMIYQANTIASTAVTILLTKGQANEFTAFLERTAYLQVDVVGYFSAPGTIDLTFPGGTPSIRTRSTSGFNTIDIEAQSGDAALRFYNAGVGQWNIRNRPGDNYLEIFELSGGGSRMVIQDATGNVGIGETTAPSYKLDVLHGGGTGIRSRSNASFSVVDIDAQDGDAALRFQRAGVNMWNTRNEPATDNYQIFEQGAGGERLRIENTTGDVVISQRLGIGMTPTFQLQLSANSAAKPTSNAWTIVSDVRVKQNIAPFKDGLATLLRINPVSYDLNGKAGMPRGEHGISVIAQEAREVVPYMISSFKAKLNPEDVAETDVLSFDSGALPFVTINAIKELVLMMGNQAATKDAEIAALKKKNSSLEARLSAIERKLK